MERWLLDRHSYTGAGAWCLTLMPFLEITHNTHRHISGSNRAASQVASRLPCFQLVAKQSYGTHRWKWTVSQKGTTKPQSSPNAVNGPKFVTNSSFVFAAHDPNLQSESDKNCFLIFLISCHWSLLHTKWPIHENRCKRHSAHGWDSDGLQCIEVVWK